MRRITPVFGILFTVGALVALEVSAVGSGGETGDPHAYFNALVARGDHWLSYSLRSQRQLDYPKNGGYAHSNGAALWVTYDPASDASPERQDAARVVIPAWAEKSAVLNATISASATLIPLVEATSLDATKVSTSFNSKGRQLKIGNEILVAVPWPAPCPAHNASCYPLDRSTGMLSVARGQHGTSAATHSARTPVLISNNNLLNQVRLPLGTSDGNSYLFTWDTYYTRSYIDSGLNNHKAYQFESNGLWLEAQTRFDGGGSGGAACFDPRVHVAGIEARSYNKLGGSSSWSQTDGNYLGPSVTKGEPILPKVSDFCMFPNRWTRWWVKLEQRANDYDYMSMWVADEVTGPIQIYANVPLSVEPDSEPSPNSVVKWWLEQNTSSDDIKGSRAIDFRDLVSYVRNFVALVNPPTDVRPLLLRPLNDGSLPPPAPGPIAPRNLRVVGGN